MNKLVKHDAIHHPDSVFGPDKCFDFEGNTYEYLGDYAPDPENDAKYRIVFDFDDYDYVAVGGRYRTEEAVSEMEQKLQKACMLAMRERYLDQLRSLGFVAMVIIEGPPIVIEDRVKHRTESAWLWETYLRNDGTLWGDANDGNVAGLDGTGLVRMPADWNGGKITEVDSIVKVEPGVYDPRNNNVLVDYYEKDVGEFSETAFTGVVFTTRDREAAKILEKVCEDANVTDTADEFHYQGWITIK